MRNKHTGYEWHPELPTKDEIGRAIGLGLAIGSLMLLVWAIAL